MVAKASIIKNYAKADAALFNRQLGILSGNELRIFKGYLSGEKDETYAESESVCENITINDWYNGLIYAMFVSETVDLNGYFHVIML